MKYKFIILTLFLVFSTSIFAQSGKNYGEKLTLKTKTPISKLLENPDNYVGKKVLVEGLIVGVCEARGCWIEISSNKEFEKILFKVDDGVMVFPLEAKGKKVLAEGVFEKLTQTKEQLIEQGMRHAKEMGEIFDPNSIQEGKNTFRLKGLGTVIN